MKLENLKYSLLLIVTTCVAYLQIASFMFSTKWDNLSAFFPYRYTSSHWWSNGAIPFWDPYQNLGYPMHANPQGSVWYPITWLFGRDGYSLYDLNMELMLHIVLAALGMYFFVRQLKIGGRIAFITGLAYALSGFVMGTSAMIGFTAGAAYLPWVLLFYKRVLDRGRPIDAVYLAVVLYLQLTGAYVAFTIVLVYVLAAYLIIRFIRSDDRFKILKRTGLMLMIAVPITLILSSAFLYSIYDSLPYFSRAEALPYSEGQFGGNFSWMCFLSLVVPYMNMSSTGFPGVDVSLSNIYIGIPFLLFFLLYVIRTKHSGKWIWIGSAAMFFILALGLHTPVHRLAYQILPGFDLFRHPYLFSLFGLFLMLVGGAIAINHRMMLLRFKAMKLTFLIGGIVVLISLIALVPHLSFEAWNEYIDTIKHFKETSPLNSATHAFMQLMFVLLLLVSLIVASGRPGRFRTALPIIVILDLLVAVQLNAPKNVYYNTKFNWLNDYMQENATQSLTNQQCSTPLNTMKNSDMPSATGFWVNLNTYSRTTGTEGYNPFIFTRYIELQESVHFPNITRHGLMFTTNEYDVFADTGPSVLVNKVDADSGVLRDMEIGYNTFVVISQCDTTKRLFLNQNYHHNWEAYVDRMEVEIERSNISLMSIMIPKGTHRITFKYRDDRTSQYHRYGIWMMYVVMIIIVTYGIWSLFRRQS